MVSRSTIRQRLAQTVSAFVFLLVASCQPQGQEGQSAADTLSLGDTLNQEATTVETQIRGNNASEDPFDWRNWMEVMAVKAAGGMTLLPDPELLSFKRLEKFDSVNAFSYGNLYIELEQGAFFSYAACSVSEYDKEMQIETRYGDPPFFQLNLITEGAIRSFVIQGVESTTDEDLLTYDLYLRGENDGDYTFRLSKAISGDQFNSYWKDRIAIFLLQDVSSDGFGNDGELFAPMYFAIVPDVDPSELPYQHFAPDCGNSEN